MPVSQSVSPSSCDHPRLLYSQALLDVQHKEKLGKQPCVHLCVQIVDPLSRGRAFRVVEENDGSSVPQTPDTPCTASLCSVSSSRSALNRLPRRRKRESVAVMSFKVAAALMKVLTFQAFFKCFVYPKRFRKITILSVSCAKMGFIAD